MMKFLFVFLFFSSCQSNAQIAGCTDPQANNYDENATVNNGSCTYVNATILPVTTTTLPLVMQETSGLLIYNNQLLTHNDDTDTNLYLFSFQNPTNYTTFPIPFVTNKDWEDIAEDDDYIYIGDFGNNVSGNRSDLRIFRVQKMGLQTNPFVDTILFSYENQTDFSTQTVNNTNFDCEAFIVTGNKIYLFTKEWISNQTTVYELDKTPGTHVATLQNAWNVNGLITGATYLIAKKLVVLSGYSPLLQPFIYLLYDFEDSDFFSGNKRKIVLNLPFHQVEGIVTMDGLNYYISNERLSQGISIDAKIHQLDLTPYLSDYLNNHLSVSENEIKVARIFPNPTSDFITIDLSEKQLTDQITIEIVNHWGQKVATKFLQTSSTQLNLNDCLPSNGNYVLYLKDKYNKIVYTYKIVFKRK